MGTLFNFRFHWQNWNKESFTTLFFLDSSMDDCSKKLKHISTHIGEKPFKCDDYDKAFALSGDLIRHKGTHTGENLFKCDVCYKAFTRSGHLVRHKWIHTGEKPFKCDVCDKAFAGSSDLVIHKRTHTGEKPFKCDVCDKAFTRSGHLVRHKVIHTGEKSFKCLVCNKVFNRLYNLKLHSKTHGRKNNRVARHFECKECNMKFSSPRIFDQHLLNHELEAIEPTGMEYICVHCDETFDFAKKLQDHVNEAHVLNKNCSVTC